MPIKVMFFAFNPEAIFKTHECYLQHAGIDICGYVSCLDPYQDIYNKLQPDIVCYHFGTIPIEIYATEFTCKLIAATDYYSAEDQAATLSLAANSGLHHIRGYVQKEHHFLLAAFHLVDIGRDCFFPQDMVPLL
ncbi:hypothetical protein [Paraflavitalea pollutisoli]|uniref:hypothetical protein n=1 Tax=Paraflavitalea pollutisoli TaxID=3034143 RepID=UPI0023EC5826|nr:hypothetical protein [Paraflavitalea sp. H1-2-19X]